MSSKPLLAITLHYTRRDLDALYYGAGHGQLLKYPLARHGFVLLAIALAAIIFSMRQARMDGVAMWVMGAVFGALGAVVAIGMIATQAWKLYRWKVSINRFIRTVDGTSERLECTEETIMFINDHQTIITHWAAVTQIKKRINPFHYGQLPIAISFLPHLWVNPLFSNWVNY